MFFFFHFIFYMIVEYLKQINKLFPKDVIFVCINVYKRYMLIATEESLIVQNGQERDLDNFHQGLKR